MTGRAGQSHSQHVMAATRVGKSVLTLGILLLLCWTSVLPAAAAIVREPYLQQVTPTSVTVVWRTDDSSPPPPNDSQVQYGPTSGGVQAWGAWPSTASATAVIPPSNANVTDHIVTITSLTPGTSYFYAVGTVTSSQQGGGTVNHFFTTPPTVGTVTPFRAWIFGDSGEGPGDGDQERVRDAMLTETLTNPPSPDIILHAGDIAYDDGTDLEFTTNHFAIYQDILRHTPSWPTLGNHEAVESPMAGIGPYYEAHVLPTGSSGTEAYYSFDYANVHFIVLDSMTSNRGTGDAMLTWLVSDLGATSQDWVIAYFHHPPYTKGSHDSDDSVDSDGRMTDMRENALPILEAGGVNLVLAGHSHGYERSYAIRGAYGYGSSPDFAMPDFGILLGNGNILDSGDGDPNVGGDGAYADGTVYVVAGHGGRSVVTPSGHPVMFFSEGAFGSVLLDIDGTTLTGRNLRDDGIFTDLFSINLPPPNQAPTITTQPANVTVTEPNPATFRVVATGAAPLSYQWRRNGSDIAGATGSIYVLDPTNAADDGALFDVVVSNGVGSVTSAAATLTVTGLPAWSAVAQNPTGSWVDSGWDLRSFRVLLKGGEITTTGSTVRLTLRGRTSGNYTVQRVSLVQRDGSTLDGVDATNRQVTFGDTWDAGVSVPPGGVTSDPIAFDLVAGQDVFLTWWVPAGSPTVARLGGTTTSAWMIKNIDESGTIDWGALTIDTTRSYIYTAELVDVVAAGGGAPAITTQPSPVTVTEPTAATFTVVATGTPPLSYQWRRDDGAGFSDIAGATAASYTLDPTDAAADNGAQFAVVVDNAVGPPVTSAAALLTVNAAGTPPAITTQPSPVTVTEPTAATFTVVATGTPPLSYQWRRDDGAGFSDIAGATAASYTLDPTDAAADNGAQFAVVVDNAVGPPVTSAAALLTVNAAGTPPAITTQPSPVTVTEPTAATFTVVATGTPPLSYQWRRDDGAGFSDIAGATAASYTLDPTDAAADNGAQFAVVVDNAVGPPVTSTAALLTVNAAGTPPAITTQPSPVTVTEPTAATFTVVATGTPPLSYQWRRDDGAGFSDIAGATAASYTLDPTDAAADNGAQFAVVVDNAVGPPVTSAAATLTVTSPPVVAWTAVAQNPTGSWVDSGWDLRSFRVLLKGGEITTTGSTVRLTLRGRTSGNYTVQRVSLVQRDGSTLDGVDATNRQVTFGDTWDAGVSVPPGGVTSDPIAFDLVAGQDVFLTWWVPAGSPTVARLGGTTTSAWMIKNIDESGTIDWGALTIDTTRSYIYTAELVDVVAAGGGAPAITTQPSPVTVTEPTAATFTVVATGTPPLSYQWRRDDGAGFSDIAGATAASYTLDPTDAAADNGAQFAVVVDNAVGPPVTSAAALLTVNAAGTPPAITTQPSPVTVTEPTAATFTVVATGTPPLSYQWRRDDGAGFSDIAGATAASYTLDPTDAAADNGAQFAVVVDNAVGPPVTSAAALLTVNAAGTPPAITTQPSPVTVTEPTAATFTVVATGTPPLSYQWRRDDGAGFSDIAGATAASYTLDPTDAAADNGAQFAVVVDNAVGPPVTSAAALLTVNAAGTPPAITTQPSPVTVTEPTAATFTVVATGTPPLSYQWRRDDGAGFSDIAGATAASYTLDPTDAAADNGAQFAVVVDNAVGPPVTSAAATLTVTSPPVVAWTAVAQNPTGSWVDSGWDLRSFRVLLKGGEITTTGSTVRLTLRGRTSGNYTVQRVSLVQRDGSTLDGVDATNRQVTFGDTWDAGVSVPPGGVTSDPIAFDLVAGQDVFLTWWVPAGSPTVARLGGTTTSAWMIKNIDESGTIDWEALTIDTTRSYIYTAEQMEVLP